jgi:glutamyl-tRNA synthetase
MVTLEDGPVKAGFFFEDEVQPEAEDLVGKNMTAAESAIATREAYRLLDQLPDINASTTEAPLRDLAERLELKVGQLFGILRVAVTGQKVSPPLLESMEIIGKNQTLERIQYAVELLESL